MAKVNKDGSAGRGPGSQWTNIEQFITDNRKSLLVITGAIVVLVLLYVGYTRFYLAPREQEAVNEIYKAQEYFKTDSLDKALNGDGNYKGFLAIIEEYDGTKTANLANYYTGLAYLKQGEYETAIPYLENYSAKDQITKAQAAGALGDAYAELKQYDKAIKYYQEAAKVNSNTFTSPLYLTKLALVYEATNDLQKALDTYRQLRKDYWQFAQNQQIDAQIARLEAMTRK